ncbi:ABC transporter substrate-binding protein [Nostocoides sp. F2B08]|uniref:ABC transporter substrate-binding protein n=1 Tax=Nostocoides sp. F2B08 TaxID=2653936 RepID=UPI001262C51B|nr:ABC transporter substrate-binding protein [Tetrasphaera sp. F2B08]KAB7746270.1 ABC transporter substrate-binding protein [Tetrasphaera sp. F2B08]
MSRTRLRPRNRPRIRRRLVAAVTTAALAVGLAACDVPAVGDPEDTAGTSDVVPGGSLTTMSLGPVQTWDPQRISARGDASFAARVFARSLTAYQNGPDGQAQVTLTGDLATDTGVPDQTLQTWVFTIREGIRWQDGSELTCEDVKYGISRSFAEEITGGPNYALAYLDIPKTPEGASTYLGPYAEGEDAEAGIAAFDNAVACDGQELTIRLSEPVADFPGMVSTPGFAAYKESADRGEASTYSVFSAGPYTLSGAWMPERGGTFVRNPHWSARTDPIRLARPDQIVYREGLEPQDVAQVIIADAPDDRNAVALDTAPPAIQQQIAAAEPLRERSVNSPNGIVDYLVPNFKSPTMANAQIRAAFVLATDRNAYITALGGPTTAESTTSILAHGIRLALPNPDQPAEPTGTAPPQDPETPEDAASDESDDTPAPTQTSDDGTSTADVSDRERAAELLAAGAAEEGIETPVPLRVAYRSSPTMDTALRALESGWSAAGFAVELQPIEEDYFTTISAAERADQTDVFWSNWAADWNSASTVLPPLFDSRLNISEAGSGRNYGYFVDANVDAAMSAALAIADPEDREQAWFDIDTTLRSRGAYVALAERKSTYVAGSSVEGLTTHPALGGTVDLAVIGLQ